MTSLTAAPQTSAVTRSICEDKTINSAALRALRLVCQAEPATATPASSMSPLIVVGFVGGFANPDDFTHPEPLFARYLRQRYGTGLHARVFSNHDARGAESYVLQLLDANHDGVVSDQEKKSARIVLYGHSWGASETATFARELGNLDIPVLLTAQLDIIVKPGQRPATIPSNVAEAINFYQTEGPLHGRPTIVASNPATTRILGNFRMDYDHAPVNCDNYNWFVRTFNKPHHEIENDAQVWGRIASLIAAEMQSFLPATVAARSQEIPETLSRKESAAP
jgi:pimeloyl-ACP methyl ester carboxylesterase